MEDTVMGVTHVEMIHPYQSRDFWRFSEKAGNLHIKGDFWGETIHGGAKERRVS